jgi:hypothetical protein
MRAEQEPTNAGETIEATTHQEEAPSIWENALKKVSNIVDKQSKKKLFVYMLAGLLSGTALTQNAEAAGGRPVGGSRDYRQVEYKQRREENPNSGRNKIKRENEERQIQWEQKKRESEMAKQQRDDAWQKRRDRGVEIPPTRQEEAQKQPEQKEQQPPYSYKREKPTYDYGRQKEQSTPPIQEQPVEQALQSESKQEIPPEIPQEKPQENQAKEIIREKKTIERSVDQQQLIDKLIQEVGADVVARIQALESVKNEAERQKALEAIAPISLENLEKMFAGLSKEDIDLLFKECVPKGFNVDKVSYKDEYFPIPEQYGIASTPQEPRYVAAYVLPAGKEIYIVKGVQFNGVYSIMSTIGHEVAHCGDPLRNKFLTVDERLELKGMIIERLRASDSYSSSYVKEINNQDKKIELERKANEYFAEVTQEYLYGSKPLAQGDKEMVEFVLKKVDPEFDVKNAKELASLITGKAFATTSAEHEKFLSKEKYDQLIKEKLAEKQALKKQKETYANANK